MNYNFRNPAKIMFYALFCYHIIKCSSNNINNRRYN